MIILRITKIVLILSVAMWSLIGVYGNIADWAGTTYAMEATTSMSAFDGGTDDWRATTNPAIIIIGSLYIVILKIITALLCFVGAWRMWQARNGDTVTFASAKTLALTGCAIAIFMLFSGWIVIAETYFELWRSDIWRDAALDSAFRYCGMIGVIALIVGARED